MASVDAELCPEPVSPEIDADLAIPSWFSRISNMHCETRGAVTTVRMRGRQVSMGWVELALAVHVVHDSYRLDVSTGVDVA